MNVRACIPSTGMRLIKQTLQDFLQFSAVIAVVRPDGTTRSNVVRAVLEAAAENMLDNFLAAAVVPSSSAVCLPMPRGDARTSLRVEGEFTKQVAIQPASGLAGTSSSEQFYHKTSFYLFFCIHRPCSRVYKITFSQVLPATCLPASPMICPA